MPTNDPQGVDDLIARVHDWLVSLLSNPEAAAQFAQSPQASLASCNLSPQALDSVNVRHIAADVANTPGIPAEGRSVLHSFASSPSSSSSTSNLTQVYHVTREVYHDQPIIQKIFEDHSTHIDNSQTLVNNGIIDGGVDQSNSSATAVGAGAVAGSGNSAVNAATGAGSAANQGSGDINSASGHGQVVSGSDVGQNTSNSAGSAQVGGDSNGAVNTGAVHGTQAGGAAAGNVTGSGNETATVGGHADGSGIAFGQGHAGAASGNALGGDGAVSGVGGAQSQSHDSLDHGSALGGHDASGQNLTDASTHVDTQHETLVHDSSNVDVAQDHSSAEADQHLKPVHVDVDHSAVAGGDIGHDVLHA